jgi:hypothetical protein
MKMAIAAEADIIGAKKGKNLITVISFCDGRIVEKDEFFPVTGSGERSLKTKDLAIQKFFIMGRAGFLLIKPAACAADGIVPIGDEVVMEDRQILKEICIKALLNFGGCGPPVIVVTLEDDFLPGESVNKGEIRNGLLQIHAPAEITAENAGVVGSERRKAGLQFLRMVMPHMAED